ncbi:penicillin-binding protein 2 [Thermonema lapsum]|uniref:Penicillin-binding protein 2 n=1 Tax=Thermonema lapsum TaxID=28195 RepID=A0A846MP11_9BACT|nr:penicillin-binding transpeptidase domain-containing protein [Thermonema lapsum]NIK73191.1 penicillin-binding protein 2 [Thermonema lapsum]
MQFERRKYVFFALFILVGLLFAVRLFYLQLIDDSYKEAANRNVVERLIEQPHRGLIYDRNGKLIVYNEPVYDLMLIPYDFRQVDTAAFCRLVNLSKEELIKRIRKIPNPRKGGVIIPQLSRQEYARLQEFLSDFRGVYVQARSVRVYPHQSLANALGYIAEISPKELEKDTTGYYQQGDYVGKSGIEAFYEYYMRGKKGVQYVVKNNFNQVVGAYKGGKLDQKPQAGSELIASIDLDLQAYGELLMSNKTGAIVAIEPSSGEILALISAPSYDPNLLSGPSLSKHFAELLQHPGKPLYNRAIQSRYPPGSTFKTVQALIGLQIGALQLHDYLPCNQKLVGCHGHPSPTNVLSSIRYSCNPFYYLAFRRIILQEGDDFQHIVRNYKRWKQYVESFGFGRHLGIDIANEGSGYLPDVDYFNRMYGEGRWNFSNVYSLSIGQGEIGVTPLQMANLAAIIANRGYYYTPHLIKEVSALGGPLPIYRQKHVVPIDTAYFSPIIEGMEMAFKAGTVSWQAQLPAEKQDIVICGKTGTVQNPHGEDHATFIAFAPKQNPKIAIAVYVENAGFGGVWAATIASLMIEKYLTGDVLRKELEKTTIQKSFSPKKY